MNTIRNFARILIAPVFIFSGFVKAIDPLGYTYKITDYLDAFGMDFLTPLAIVAAVLISATEMAIGLALIMNVLMRITSWVLMVFMAFFTVLTLFIAITNPVTDCGCFGDAIILTNWQTFWKNIIFMLPTLVVFFNRRAYKPLTSVATEYGLVLLFILVGVILSVFALRNLPFIDFRPYEVGTHIPAAMEIPEDAEVDEYETIFVYAKDGKEKEFKVDELGAIYEDTAWKYVDRVTELIKEGYTPPIHDFTLTTLTGIDITDSVLYSPGFSLLVIAYDLEKSDEKGMRNVKAFTEKMSDLGVMTFGMTSSSDQMIGETERTYSFPFDFYTTDEITLKTIVRSNPGVVLLYNGTIVGKWHYRNLPAVPDNSEKILEMTVSNNQRISALWTIWFFISLFFTFTLFLFILLKKRY
ncbi:MAG: DoxX family protein [Bacteroidales bacterium]|nr:DoxX family protein [Bacteroidales bacterium]MBN2818309.1 DoxX family protein [Bacteroidales bacterium]